LFAVGRAFGQVALPILFLGYALLGFQDEMTTAIDIDEAGAALVGVGKSDGPFKTIVVIRIVVGRRKGPFEAEQLSQFDDKQLVICVFAAARRLPARDKLADLLFGGHLLVNHFQLKKSLVNKSLNGIGL